MKSNKTKHDFKLKDFIFQQKNDNLTCHATHVQKLRLQSGWSGMKLLNKNF